MNKTLQAKRVLHTALVVLLLSVVSVSNVYAYGYEFFAETCPSGQTLYYKVDDNDPNCAIVVAPYTYHFDGQSPEEWDFWTDFERPEGDVVIPETLSNGMVVKTIGCMAWHTLVRPWYCGAFAGCTGITSVVIPNTVTAIQRGAFEGCSGLVSVTIGNSVTDLGNSGGYGPAGAFNGCSALTTIDFGNSVAVIGSQAFSNCSSLTSVSLPNSLLSIGEAAFSGCTALNTINIPSSVYKISKRVFENTGWYDAQSEGVMYLDHWIIGRKGDFNVTGELVVPEGTRGIAAEAYTNDDMLPGITSVSFPQSLVSIGDGAFAGHREIAAIDLPNALKYIGKYAFEGCLGLTTVTIPKNVIEIGYSAFGECSQMTRVYYNAKNAACGEKVFRKNPSLATLDIGPDVERIDANVFKDCGTVHLVVALGSTPASLELGAFSDIVENSILMVSCGKKMTYYSSWNMFGYDKIVENCDPMPISMSAVGSGGSVTPSSTTAQLGDEVLLTVTPNAGMALKSISIFKNNDPTQTIPYYFPGKATSTIAFVMPSFAVTVKAIFGASGTSIDEADSVPVSVYPNPTQGEVRVEAEGMRSVSVYNLIGQQIFNVQANGNEFEFDFNSHEPGVYLVRIETDSGVATKRVVFTK